jgi:hypothetical protein
MQPFHSQQRDDRRRRVLADDRAADAAVATKAPPRARKAEAYTDRAKPHNHRRVSDLVPQSYLTISLLFVSGLLAIGGLVAADVYLPEIVAWGTKDGAAALDLAGRGSLGSCFAAVWLASAGVFSLVIYSIRRHKIDDYRGHYRWWFVAGIAWLVMSVDSITGLHDLFRAGMTRLSGYNAPAAGHAWWIGVWGLLLAATVVRLLLDMRACRVAMVAIVLALGLWAAGITVQLASPPMSEISPALVSETLKLCGHLLLLAGVTVYARYVILHAQGLLPSRDAKRRKDRAKKETKPATNDLPAVAAKSDSSASTRIDPAHKPPAAANKRSEAATHTSSVATPHSHLASQSSDDDDDDDLDDDETGRRKLSKAERRKMRKQRPEDRDW